MTEPRVIIGTSGSPDYLKGTAGEQRYWPVSAPPPAEAFSACPAADDGACDGLHVEGSPPQYLCTRCFPARQEPEEEIA